MRSERTYSQEKNDMHFAGIGHQAMLAWFRGMDIFLTMPVPTAHEPQNAPAAQVTEAQDCPMYIHHDGRPALEGKGDELKRIPTGIDIPSVVDIPQQKTLHPGRWHYRWSKAPWGGDAAGEFRCASNRQAVPVVLVTGVGIPACLLYTRGADILDRQRAGTSRLPAWA